MAAALGAKAALASVVGDDADGRLVRDMLEQIDVDTRGVLNVSDRSTTVKERLLGRAQLRYPHQMMRVDRESDHPVAADCARRLLAAIAEGIDRLELVLVSDYNKGVCKGEMIPRVVALARSAGVPVLADPVRGADYRRYAGCACITPNRVEAAEAAGMAIRTPEDGLTAARQLLRFGVESVIVTLDRDGMAWASRSGQSRLFPARPRQVYDVTGAGDMVLATLGYCLAAGADLPTAIEVANVAGGLEVERLGVAPVSCQEILAELGGNTRSTADKMLSFERLDAEIRRLRQARRRIVMTNGCFDLLHPGHVACLQEARRQGDCLLVGLNSDRSVAELKGAGHPIVDEQGRAEMLSALACVDYVVIFDEPSVARLVARVLPDVLAKGGQYAVEQIVGYEVVLARGGRVLPLPMKGHYSTSGLLGKIQGLPDRKRIAA
jgi:D-beta-D-heptose 7-phosphate kinase/D-beta-D-heptose 1-phosphate adenosyltransferase